MTRSPSSRQASRCTRRSKPADELAAAGIQPACRDAYSVKPLDVRRARAPRLDDWRQTVVAEDHWPEGGLGSAVLEALAESAASTRFQFRHLAPRELLGSGTPAELLDFAGISAKHIGSAARELAD